MTLSDAYEAVRSQHSDISDHIGLLASTVLDLDAKVVIELGVRSGNSTVAFAYALSQTGGRLWSCDIEWPSIAREVVEWGGWTLTLGNDLDLVEQAPRPADVLFIDTNHTYDQTLAELRAYVPLVREGGVVLLHDTVSHPPVAEAIAKFCDNWENHREGSGLGVIRL